MKALEKERAGIIYLITNLLNNKQYVGQTVGTLKSRWVKHIYKSKKGFNYYICNAIKKYGEKNFSIVTIEENVPESKLDEREIYWISTKHTFVDDGGYNLTRGGAGQRNKKVSQETREKISKKLKEWFKENPGPHLGKHPSKETRKKMSEASKGRPCWSKGLKMPEEYCKKLSDAHKGKKNHNYGKPRDPETRAKIAASVKETHRKRMFVNRLKDLLA